MDRLTIHSNLVSITRLDFKEKPTDVNKIYEEFCDKKVSGIDKYFLIDTSCIRLIRLNQYTVNHLMNMDITEGKEESFKPEPNSYSLFFLKYVIHSKVNYTVEEDFDVRDVKFIKDSFYNSKNYPFEKTLLQPFNIMYHDKIYLGELIKNHSEYKQIILPSTILLHYDNNGDIDFETEINCD